MDDSSAARECTRFNSMTHLWMLLLMGVIVVVIVGAVLQRLGRMVGGCFWMVFVVALSAMANAKRVVRRFLVATTASVCRCLQARATKPIARFNRLQAVEQRGAAMARESASSTRRARSARARCARGLDLRQRASAMVEELALA